MRGRDGAWCCIGHGTLDESDVLVLTLDMTDTESHAAATDAVIKHFAQVASLYLSNVGVDRDGVDNTVEENSGVFSLV